MKTKPLTKLITTNARIILYYKHAEQTWRDPQGLKQMLVLEKYQNLNSSKQYSRKIRTFDCEFVLEACGCIFETFDQMFEICDRAL